jgi:hypothetical protein
MAKFLEGQIKSLTGAVVTEEVPRAQPGVPLKPNVLENQPAPPAVEQTHRGSRRAPPLRRAARVEDLEAVFGLVQGKMAVTEDDGLGAQKAPTQARQPAFGGAGIVSYRNRPPVDLDLQLGWQ